MTITPDIDALIERGPTKLCEACGARYHKHPTKPKWKWELQRFCSAGCASKIIQPAQVPSVEDMVETMKSRSPVSAQGCWEYSMAIDAYGYAYLKWAGKTWRGHRLMWRLMHGSIPAGAHVLHKCDNRRCVNPGHLFLGDNAANTADRNRKSRQAKGERIHTAILSESDVLEIRKSSASTATLAARYGVSAGTIGNVRSGRRWRHLLALKSEMQK